MTAAVTTSALTILVVGATGSVGQIVVKEAIHRGHKVRALVRDLGRGRQQLPNDAQLVVGELSKVGTLESAVAGIDAVIFTHGSDGTSKLAAEQVDYGAVRNVLHALQGRPVRIALMTSIGTTNRDGAYNKTTEVHDWKRRSERLVRASGLPYTIVRPGWFDYNAADQHHLVFLQGDKRHTGSPKDGVVARRQIAQVLVESLTSTAARYKTLELVAERGAPQDDLECLFRALLPDGPQALDAVMDAPNMPWASEPAHIQADYRCLLRI